MRHLNLFILLLFFIINSAFAATENDSSAYQFSFQTLDGKPMPLSQYKGKVLLIVNTASKCGFTPQYKNLQTLYQRYEDDGLVIIGVPSPDFGNQEFYLPKQVASFTEDNYSVSFPLTSISHVKGANADPLYVWASEQLGQQAVPKWNFHKLLIGKNGELVAAFPSSSDPLSKPVLDSVQAELKK